MTSDLIEVGTLKGLGCVFDNMYEQCGRVYSSKGISPTVSTVGGGNQEIKVLIEEREKNIAAIRGRYNHDGVVEQQLEPSVKSIANTITSVQKDNMLLERATIYRIRKLTPKEVWRLMDFDDEDYNKAKYESKEISEEILIKYPKHKGKRIMEHGERIERMSKSQLYKQAGNSIVVACLEGIFKNLFY
jgi:DNA (cytosine-5)-methyltransferase 1